MVFLLQESVFFKVVSFIIFIIAAFTDYLDGKIARSRNEITDLGKFLDPLADKLFVSAALIIFLYIDELAIQAWPVVLIISREFIINGLRTFASSRGKIIAASKTGKFKTFFQMLAVASILLILVIENFEYMANYIVILTMIITLYSGIDYFIRNMALFKEPKGKDIYAN